MRTEYDFSKMKGRRNPYAARLKKPVTMRLGADDSRHGDPDFLFQSGAYRCLALLFLLCLSGGFVLLLALQDGGMEEDQSDR